MKNKITMKEEKIIIEVEDDENSISNLLGPVTRNCESF